MDTISKRARSRTMSHIRSTDTQPELAVRRVVHRLGYRFRLHRRDLPGCPDLVFPRLRAVIFVHGCFWHSHRRCADGHLPQTRREYWVPKLTGNKRRDARNARRLRALGWRVGVVWACQTEDPARLARTLSTVLSPSE